VDIQDTLEYKNFVATSTNVQNVLPVPLGNKTVYFDISYPHSRIFFGVKVTRSSEFFVFSKIRPVVLNISIRKEELNRVNELVVLLLFNISKLTAPQRHFCRFIRQCYVKRE
jgi:hypothetical protein